MLVEINMLPPYVVFLTNETMMAPCYNIILFLKHITCILAHEYPFQLTPYRVKHVLPPFQPKD